MYKFAQSMSVIENKLKDRDKLRKRKERSKIQESYKLRNPQSDASCSDSPTRPMESVPGHTISNERVFRKRFKKFLPKMDALKTHLLSLPPEITNEDIASLVESLFPLTLWTLISDILREILGVLSRKSLNGGVPRDKAWSHIWTDDVEWPLKMVIFGATSNLSEIRSNVSQIKERKILTQSMVIVSIMLFMRNPQNIHILQAPFTLLLRGRKRIQSDLLRITNALGITCSMSNSSRVLQQYSLAGQSVSKLTIQRAVSLGFPILLSFDNIDWSNLHMMHFLWVIGSLPLQEKLPLNLCDLFVSHLEETDVELLASNMSALKRYQYAFILSEDDINNSVVEGYVTCQLSALEDHDPRN